MQISNVVLACFVLGILFSFSIQEQEKYPYSKWTTELKEKANTAKSLDYLSEQEKEVIYLCNLARLDGKLFAETYVQHYIDEGNVRKSSYTGSLIYDLRKSKKLEVFQPQKDLYDCAKNHATVNGEKGAIGHQNYTKRFKQFANRYSYNGENCDYGNDQALDIVMSLLIDEDIPDKGHRKNILNANYFYIGVSIQPHKKEDWNCVMDFGGKL